MARLKLPARDWLAAPELNESVRALARRGEVCRYAKGTLLIQEGVPGDTLYIVLHGRLRAYGSHAASDREITYGTYGAGEYVGEMGLDGGPRAASVLSRPCVPSSRGARSSSIWPTSPASPSSC